MSNKNVEINDLLAESTFVDDRELPFIIDKLSSIDINPNNVDVETLEGEGKTLTEIDSQYKDKDIDSDIENFANEFTGESSLKVYLREITALSKEFPVLSKEDELALAKKAKEGNQYAREKLINSNLRLVIFNAKKFLGKGVALEDLIQEGNEGLCFAVDKFDYKKNFRFSTYATWWILQRIRKCVIAKDGIIRIPPHIIYKTQKINQAQEQFKKEHNRAPTKEELAEICDFPVKTIETVLNTPSCSTILDSKVDDESETSVGDILVNEDEISVEDLVNRKILSEKINKALALLEERERYVIIQRFMYRKSLQKIGDELGGLCRERIRQIQNEALEKLSFDPSILEVSDK